MAGRRRVPETVFERFLEAYARCGTVGKAVKASGTNHQTILRKRKDSPKFEEAYLAAEEAYRDTLRDAAHCRAVEGWLEPVFQGGKQIGVIRKYSDRLLIEMLKAKVPEYRKDGPAHLIKAEILVTPATQKSEVEFDAIIRAQSAKCDKESEERLRLSSEES